MRFQLLSDIHFEHMADQGRSFIAGLDPSICDVLLLAGDISDVGSGLLNALALLCQKYAHVVYVPGNHDYGCTTRGNVNATIQKAKRRNTNLHVLQRDIVHLGGKRILGATLWFPPTEMARLQAEVWSDFKMIPGFSKWVYEENAKDVTFFRRELREGDIVVTHYLPSWRSVHPKWAVESTNCFFVCDIEELIVDRKPALWVHGHTHESADYAIGPTRVVCNPFGYVDVNMLNGRFREDLIIEVP